MVEVDSDKKCGEQGSPLFVSAEQHQTILHNPQLGLHFAPIGFDGSKWNLYEYVGSNPLVRFDPSGLYPNPLADICSHKCSPLHSSQGTAIADLTLFNSHAEFNPGISKGLSIGTEQLIEIISKLAKKLPGGSKTLIKMLTEAAKEALANALALEGGVNRRNNVAIWLKVEGECCETETCCIIYERRDWQQKEYWTKCKAKDELSDPAFPGFKVDDDDGIAAALPGCVTTALADFDCPEEPEEN